MAAEKEVIIAGMVVKTTEPAADSFLSEKNNNEESCKMVNVTTSGNAVPFHYVRKSINALTTANGKNDVVGTFEIVCTQGKIFLG